MFSQTSAAVALIGLASSSLVAAAPAPSGGWWSASNGWSMSTTTVTPTYTISSFPTEVSPDGNKFRFPLSNDFPNPNSKELDAINEAAGGTISNNTPPSNISSEGITNLQIVAFNELFEVAYFTDLLKNVTHNVTGYEIPDGFTRDFLIETLITVQAQEQLHTKNANNGLQNVAHVDPISPCEYTFPVDNLIDAIALSQKFTDLVMGTLQNVATIFADNDDNGFVQGIVATVGQEGEQNGFYRVLQRLRPSAQPFLTTSVRDFAFSALNQNFIVPGSCPDINNNKINLTIFDPLTLVTPVVLPEDQLLTYSFAQNTTGYHGSTDDLQLVLISGQNKPIVSGLENVRVKDGTVTFDAPFNFDENLLFGLTIAVVTTKDVDFTDAASVAAVTKYGPALIEVL